MYKSFHLSTLLLLLIAFGFNNVNAQNIGINATGAAPDGGAMLDISATNKGLLIPRINIPNLSSISPIVGSTTTSMLVYNTNATTGLGYYYWDGTRWVSLSADANAWKITGNAGTTPGTNFLGTTDAQALRIRTNNANRFEFTTDGRLRSFDYGSAALPTYSWNGSTNMGMYGAAANVLAFSTTGVERMRIAPNGNVGIGVIPNANNNILNVQQTTTTGTAGWFNTTSNTPWVTLEASASSTTQGTGVSGLGYTGVNGATTTAAGWAGYFQGDVACTGTYYGSDRRWKKNITTIDKGQVLSKLMLLEPRQYNFDAENFPGMGFDSTRLHYGFIAQDLEKVFPTIVSNDKSIPDPKVKRIPGTPMEMKEGYYMVNYVELIPVTIKAIQEQQAIIESQNARIEALEKSLQELKDAINKK